MKLALGASTAPATMIPAKALVSDFSEAVGLLEAADEIADKLPSPAGYRILVAMPVIKEKTSKGVFLPEVMTSREETASLVSMVVELGPDAFKDQSRFPSGAYCKPGDFVVTRSYSGTRMKFRGVEFRFINDDSIEGVVKDPTEVQRA